MSVGAGAGLPPASSTGLCGRIPVCGDSFKLSSSTGGGDSEKSFSTPTSGGVSRAEPSSRMSPVSRETDPGSMVRGMSRPDAAAARRLELSTGGWSSRGSASWPAASIVTRTPDSDGVCAGTAEAAGDGAVGTGGAAAGRVSGAGCGTTTRTGDSGSEGQPMACDVLGSPVLFSGHPRARLTNPLTSRVDRAGIPLAHVRQQYSPQSQAGPVHRPRVDECATVRPPARRARVRRTRVPPLRTIPSSPA